MTVHRDYANKSCPGEYLYSRHGDIAAKVNAQLGVVEEDEDMTQETFNEMMNNYLIELAEKNPNTYSTDARAWAEKKWIY